MKTTATQTDRKTIVRDLDVAASRSHIIEREPATAKQCWYLAGLLEQAGLDADAVECGICNTQAVLTKSMASRRIEEIKKFIETEGSI